MKVDLPKAIEQFKEPVVSDEERSARRGPSKYETQQAKRESKSGRLKKFFYTALGVLAISGSIAVESASRQSESKREQATEACVSALVGREVDLVEDGFGGGRLEHPAGIYSEQVACDENGNDPELAAQNIRYIPLDVNKQ